MTEHPFARPRAVGLALLLTVLLPRLVRAENSVSYKYEDYQESGGRIAVETHGARIEKDLGVATVLKLEGLIDAIAGATPTGEPAPAGSDRVPLTRLSERRKAWNADVTHLFPKFSLAAGVANSRESDYVSTGWSLNAAADFNEKNTTLRIGAAGTDDDVKVFFQTPREKKRTGDFIVGVTQLLNPHTSVAFNLTFGRQRGYLTDPYKLVEKNVEILPGLFLRRTFAENRPREREKRIALFTLNRSFPQLRGALDASYRFYNDSFGIDANTIDLAWFQRIGERVILRPAFRFYDQTAASFYYYRLNNTPIVPASNSPAPQGPFYSSDYRLSALRTHTYGLKAIWNATDALQFNAAVERYDMRGRDGVTPRSAYSEARIVSGGVKFTW